jgi:DNA ligase D-like protein (predicted 3'-phosphoesterase)
VAEEEHDRRYVVQRHRATRDHYDLRLELDGVLVSWAVPKGPTLDSAQRRTAFKVDDHPLEYVDFEGVIPRGTYGGGDVTIWDRGTWQPARTDDPAASLRAGELHVDLSGEKLHGRFALVKRARDGEDNAWLLVKKRDEHAVAGWEPDAHPRSVKSGRTNDEVAADPTHLWRSDLPAAKAAIPVRPPAADEEELAALDALGAGGTWSVHGRELKVTNLDKVLSSAVAGPRPGTIACGSISSNGTRTKARSCMRGWGSWRAGLSIFMSPTISRSRSRVRGAFAKLRRRPCAFSIACNSASSRSGGKSVSSCATAFTYSGWSACPIGAER